MLYAGDLQWWDAYKKQVVAKRWPEYRGERWSISNAAKSRYGLNWIRGENGAGLCKREGTTHTGGNSGYAVLGLLAQFGVARIVLLGYDMQRTGRRSHWHGDHPTGLGNGGPYPQWVKRFARAAQDFDALGIEVINASRATALTCFKRLALDEALKVNGDVDRTDSRRDALSGQAA